MATYFLDTSAIIKRYFPEQGHDWLITLCDPFQGHELYISQAALVEVVATICRKARENNISITERNRLIAEFRQDSQDDYILWLVTAFMYISAGDLCRTHRLRAYDAVQLACALGVRNDSTLNQAPEPIFVSADTGLLEFAIAEGFSIENPNSYP
jgi:uncharacterized protein